VRETAILGVCENIRCAKIKGFRFYFLLWYKLSRKGTKNRENRESFCP